MEFPASVTQPPQVPSCSRNHHQERRISGPSIRHLYSLHRGSLTLSILHLGSRRLRRTTLIVKQLRRWVFARLRQNSAKQLLYLTAATKSYIRRSIRRQSRLLVKESWHEETAIATKRSSECKNGSIKTQDVDCGCRDEARAQSLIQTMLSPGKTRDGASKPMHLRKLAQWLHCSASSKSTPTFPISFPSTPNSC